MEPVKVVQRSTGKVGTLVSKVFKKRYYEFSISMDGEIEIHTGRVLQDAGFLEVDEPTVYTEIRTIWQDCVVGTERIDHRHDDDTERYVDIMKSFAIEIEYTMQRTPQWCSVQQCFIANTHEISSRIIKDTRPNQTHQTIQMVKDELMEYRTEGFYSDKISINYGAEIVQNTPETLEFLYAALQENAANKTAIKSENSEKMVRLSFTNYYKDTTEYFENLAGKEVTLGKTSEFVYSDAIIEIVVKKTISYKSRFEVLVSGSYTSGAMIKECRVKDWAINQYVPENKTEYTVLKELKSLRIDYFVDNKEVFLPIYNKSADVTVSNDRVRKVMQDAKLKTRMTVVFENADGFLEIGIKTKKESDTIELGKKEITNNWRTEIIAKFGEHLVFSVEQTELINKIMYKYYYGD